ncbi:hypothetical protein F8388_026692 [Cannabis sativa]|uniref:Protein LNK2 n=1 Tax=Cannabis sativa TaxID=3483 RepID=A0A7J6H1B6_CANSA|nr:hypothetical protein F8388_026692 [Cannabis sativa]
MFDWDEEELANIIWDEAAENGDHIVPYPAKSEDCRNKKEWKQEANINKPTEQNNSKVDLRKEQVESSTNLINHDKSSDSRMGVESWPDLPLSNSERESMGTNVSNALSEITKFDSSTGTDQLDKDAEIYPSSHEGKEQGDFDYGWANIGSFDDFERIFSNDDAVFGQTSLGNADELWCSSKDITNSPDKSFPISSELLSLSPKTVSNTSQQLEIKTKVVQEDDLCSLRYGETDDSTSHSLHSVNAILEHAEDAVGKSEPLAKEKINLDRVVKTTLSTSNPAIENASTQNKNAEKVFSPTVTRQKKLFKSRKKSDVKSEGKQLQELYGAWPSPRNHSGQLENRIQHPAIQPSPSTVQQMQLQCPEIFHFQHIPNQFVVHPMYGNLANTFPAMPVLSRIQPGKYKQQPLLSSRDVSPANSNLVNNSAETPVKTTIMTPQEKIEKLRRRQQFQAMLAIQKQQQQLSQQVSSSNHSTTQTCPQQFGGSDVRLEDLSTFSSLEPISPMEEDDSSSTSAAIDDYSVNESILHRLQDVISKLDMTVRICIRDSLFRLAQSARERQNLSSTNKGSKDERETLAVDVTNTSNRLGATETETNSMDRTIAHLLFHTPLELSGKQPEQSESTFSAKLPCETRREASAANVAENLKSNIQCFGQQETKVCSNLVEPQSHKDISHMDTSENASLKEQLTDGGVVPSIESSQ